ncbi:zinc finger, CCHC-type containing protein, partial [Tanacetum coccineum]
FEEFKNVFIRIGFGSTINMVSFDGSQVVTFNGKFVYGFRNSDRGTRNRQLSGVEVDCFFDRMELFCFVDEVYDSEYIKDDDVAWLNIISDNVGSAFMSTSKLNDSILWHVRMGHVHYKRMQDMSKDGLILAFDMHIKSDEALDKFKVFKIEVELQQRSLIKRFRTDRGGEYMDTLYFQSVGIIHETTVAYTPQQNGKSKRKNRVLKEMVNSMFSYSGLSQGFWGEVMLTVCYLLNRVSNKRNMITSYELWTKKKPNLSYLRVWGCRAVHSKAFRFYVIEHNDLVAINSIIESRDAIFDEHRFSSVSIPSQRSLEKGTEDSGGTRDEVFDQHSYYFNVKDDPKTFDKAMKSQDVAVWKEAINDEMDSIMDGTVEKFKARLVIQGFKQKSGIDYFDTYAPVACISTIRLLIAMASIHSLIIHQMDVKTAFLNGELEEEVYMNQPLGFIMPGNENKVDVTKEFLSSRFSIKDMGEADVILGIRIKHESNIITISQSHYIKKVLKKFNYLDYTPVSTPVDTCEKLMPNNGLAISQFEYSRVIGCLMYAMTCTRPDIAFIVGKLSRYTSNPVLEGYTDASWISNTKYNSSTSGWVFLLAAGKEAEWLKNMLLEIPLWVKPIAPISIRCDSAATFAKAYSQMYNGKCRSQ